MNKFLFLSKADFVLSFVMGLLIVLSIVVLKSIAPSIFPLYFVFIVLGILVFLLFLQIDFEVLTAFSKYLYVISIVFLIIPLIVGQVTRGVIRWIPIGQLTIQPSEIVRPFLLIFFAVYLTQNELTLKRLIKSGTFALIPILLISIQPSLGVAILTGVGFIGVLLASAIKKKYLLFTLLGIVILIPFAWLLLASYQKQRVVSFIDPSLDPSGASYNSIQSMITVGSGKVFGRGLGKGVQTQLAFLPEKHTDFVFAAVSEELGFLGASLLLLCMFILLLRITFIADNSKGPTQRAFVSGVFLVYFVESLIHVGMNIGLLPITGVPLPLVSAGGSAFLATMTTLAIVMSAKKESFLS